MTGEVTLVYDDGTVTARLHGIATQITIGAEQLALVAKKKNKTQAENSRYGMCRIRVCAAERALL